MVIPKVFFPKNVFGFPERSITRLTYEQGTADVFLETSVDVQDVGSASEKRKIQEVAAGEFIGEVALVLDESTLRTASVVATSQMRVAVIKKQDLGTFFERDPEVGS